jgi:hypothetical protein
MNSQTHDEPKIRLKEVQDFLKSIIKMCFNIFTKSSLSDCRVTLHQTFVNYFVNAQKSLGHEPFGQFFGIIKMQDTIGCSVHTQK